MLPYDTILHIDRSLATPVYLQVVNQLARKISSGTIPSGLKLPGARKMANLLGLSRTTIILAYDELEVQGWIRIFPNKGTFVNNQIPQKPERTDVLETSEIKNPKIETRDFAFLNDFELISDNTFYKIDTGYPDVRLAPTKDIAQYFSRFIRTQSDSTTLNYSNELLGDTDLRVNLLKHLNETRGFRMGIDNLMISRGSLMAFNCIFQNLLQPGNKVAVGDVSFKVANNIINMAGGSLVKIPIDEYGIDTMELEKICRSVDLKAVFVMPHHHHPTTVTLIPERRVHLLQLADEYDFIVIEDDYDYDFHYDCSPHLPMFSLSNSGRVIYVGSFSKTVAPGLRMGFIAGPSIFIHQLAKYARHLDCHGNIILEKSISMIIKEGILQRHLRKSLQIYQKRRDLFCDIISDEFASFVKFKKPTGGLAVWMQFSPEIPVLILHKRCLEKGLLISKTIFENQAGDQINAIRMGFASQNYNELIRSIEILRKVLSSF